IVGRAVKPLLLPDLLPFLFDAFMVVCCHGSTLLWRVSTTLRQGSPKIKKPPLLARDGRHTIRGTTLVDSPRCCGQSARPPSGLPPRAPSITAGCRLDLLAPGAGRGLRFQPVTPGGGS